MINEESQRMRLFKLNVKPFPVNMLINVLFKSVKNRKSKQNVNENNFIYYTDPFVKIRKEQKKEVAYGYSSTKRNHLASGVSFDFLSQKLSKIINNCKYQSNS